MEPDKFRLYSDEDYKRLFVDPDSFEQTKDFFEYYDSKGNQITEEEFKKNEIEIFENLYSTIVYYEKFMNIIAEIGLYDKIQSEQYHREKYLNDLIHEIEKNKKVFKDKTTYNFLQSIILKRGYYVKNVKDNYNMNMCMNDTDCILQMEKMDDRSFKNMFTGWLKDFRVLNSRLYSRNYHCPYCYEECKQSELLDLAGCGHVCCLTCWRMRANLVIENSLAKISCSICDTEIPVSTIIDKQLIDSELLDRFLVVKSKKQPGSKIFDCGKCGGLFWSESDCESVNCPMCKNFVCKLCGEYAHNTTLINISCKQFEKYKKTDEYFEFEALMEEYREEKIRDEEEAERQERLRRMEEEENLRRRIEEERRAREEERRRRKEERQRLILKQEKQTEEWIQSHTKACPKCHSRIEKNKGCNHMTCLNCKHEFCWYCFKEIIGNNGAHHHFNVEGCAAGKKWFDDGYRDN